MGKIMRSAKSLIQIAISRFSFRCYVPALGTEKHRFRGGAFLMPLGPMLFEAEGVDCE